MTKEKRKASAWTNSEISEDAAGYLTAQKLEREDAAAAEHKRSEERAREDFVKSYVGSGGDPTLAAEAFAAHRGEQAASAAAVEHEAARRYTRNTVMGRI